MASVFVELLCRDLTTTKSRVKVLRMKNEYTPPQVAKAAVRPKAVALLLLIYCLMHFPLFQSVFVFCCYEITLCPF